MTQGKRCWWAGAYALTATLDVFSDKDAAFFYAEIAQMPGLAGLELPVHRLEKKDDPWRQLQHLPRDLDYIITPLPYVMQSLERDPAFGLASRDAAGREAALAFMSRLKDAIKRLDDHCGRAAVRAVQLHSAPAARADASAFRDSLERISAMNFGAVELWIEHCDAFRPGQTAAKGFLDLPQEIALAQEWGLGICINWGRSVLETRRAEGALEHLAAASKAGVLRAFFLSGTAMADPLYGTWLDNHALIAGVGSGPWRAEHSLLTPTEVQKASHAAAAAAYLGLKIQPFPISLPLVDRLACLRQHLQSLQGIA